MKFKCHFRSERTGELKELISTLDPDEVATVERVRRTEGDDAARITAAAFVLRSAYDELSALEWSHMGAPELLTLN